MALLDVQGEPLERRHDTRTIAAWLMLTITLLSLVFTAGYNWRRIDELTDAQKKNEVTYVRVDVSDQQWRAVNASLDEIRRQLVELQRSTDRRSRP